MFQSTPPSEERSDMLRVAAIHPRLVSIHAPLRREERPLPSVSSSHSIRCFNPRPPPKRGATRGLRQRPSQGTVSIHAPLRREERPEDPQGDSDGADVSIHAPLRREERRPSGKARIWPGKWFQSTPPSEERSDSVKQAVAEAAGCFNPRPPPKRGATAS